MGTALVATRKKTRMMDTDSKARMHLMDSDSKPRMHLRNRKHSKQMSKQAVLTKAFHEVLVHDVNGDGVSFVLAVLLLLLA